MRTRTGLLGVLATAATLLMSACGVTTGGADASAVGEGDPVAGLRIMVPNAPGGGYDSTARTVARVMEESDVAAGVQVFNLPGASGTVGLQRTVNEAGNGRLAMQMGLGVVGASHTSTSTATLTQTTALAKLIEEAGAIVVPRDSSYMTIGDLVTAWRRDPERTPIGGGSTKGGPDHLLSMRLAKAVGIAPRRVNYISYDGGGELLPSILGGKIAFGASGYGEFLEQVQAGQVRVLAVTSEKPIAMLPDVPTLKSSGIDLVFTNWRGIVAPPGISDDDERVWIDALKKMHDSGLWKAELARRGWSDSFLTGEEFALFLAEQDRVVAGILTELGLT